MLVGVLITIMISIVVGLALVPTVVTAANTAKNPVGVTLPTGLGGMIDVVSYVFVAIILLGAVSWIGGQQ